jgi:mannose-6-phosphate isomerase-like protein (cupin superfamily)
VEGFKVTRFDELASINHGAVKLAADDLGVRSFGLQLLDLPASFADYPEHDHSNDRQEEVYVVLNGSAEFEVSGRRVPVEGGSMLWVAPDAKRKLVAGPYGVRILAIGCTADGKYQRPDSFRVGAHA